MNNWTCDNCGKPTVVNPRTKPILVEDGERTELVIDEKTKKPKVLVDKKTGLPGLETKKVKNFVRKTKKTYSQSTINGKITEIDTDDVEFIDEPTVFIKLRIGHENVMADFCRECTETYLGAELKALRDKIISARNSSFGGE